MIDLKNQTISVPDRSIESILRWEVWFITDSGLSNEPCNGMPIPVAIGATSFEPFLLQGVLEDGD